MDTTDTKLRVFDPNDEEVALMFLTGGLQALRDTQEVVSAMVPDTVPASGEFTKPIVTATALSMIMEVCELVNEHIPWKPWKPAKPLENPEKAMDEFADILAFLGLMIVIMERRTGCTVADLVEAYKKKTVVNMNRFSGKVEEYR